jgi:hypothetical protein
MQNLTLIPFEPKTAPPIAIEVELHHNAECLFISFRIRTGVTSVDLGNGTPHKERIKGLWEKTCFELFIKNQKGQYLEFNFSPLFEWNCFYFEAPGAALKEWEMMQKPETDILLSLDHFLHYTVIKKEYFPPGFFDREDRKDKTDGANELHAGITAVIKDKKGQLSYWALAHADKRPNFHHFDSFKYKF